MLLTRVSSAVREALSIYFQSGVLDHRITFSRTSNATITNSAGQIAYAPHNLLTYSEQFDNSAWIKTGTTVTANTIVAPDGTITVDKIVEVAAASLPRIVNGTVVTLVPYTISVYAKAAERTQIIIVGDASAAKSAYFDLANGTVVSVGNNATASISLANNGFYRCILTYTPAATGNGFYIATAENGATISSGDNTKGLYLWGAQLEIGTTASTYNSTTVKNLLGYSELFDNAAWTKSNSFVQTNLLTYSEDFTNAAWSKTTVTATANSIVAPNGYQTADTLSATGANSTALQTFTASAVPYTYSVYLYRKTGTGNIDISVDGTTWVTKAITAGWTRVDTTLTPAAGAKTAGIRIATNGDEVYAWGAQLVQGSTAGDYRRTDAAALPVYYANHNGVVCAEQIHASAGNGTFLESYTSTGGSQTFSIWLRRISGTGNVDLTMDSGATYSTQTISSTWARYSVTSAPAAGAKTAGVRIVTSGDVIQAFGAMVSDSASLDPYVLNIAAAPSAAAYYGPRFDYDPVTLQPKGLLIEEQRQNLVLNATLDGANLATQNVTVTAVAHTISFYGTGQIVLSGTASATATGTGAYPTRKTLTFTPTAGTLTLTVTGTVQYAQLEIGSFATSFIPTAGSQVTRTVDVATIQGSNFYSWFNANEGTFFANSITLPSTAALRTLSCNDTTTTNQISLRITSSVGLSAQIAVGGVDSISFGTANTANTQYKKSLAYKLNDAAYSENGTLQTDTTVNLPIVSQMNIGSTTTTYGNGTIKQISYYSTRLPNSTLQAITA